MNTAYIELTNTCNLRCASCYNHSSEGSELPLELLLNALIRFDIQGCIFSGGEPLLYSQLNELMCFIESRPNQPFVFVTNGTIHDQRIIEAHNRLPNLEIQVSLDGSCEEVNAPLRGKGTHALTTRFIQTLQHPTKKPRVKMVISRANVNDVESFYRFVLSIGGVPEFSFVTEMGRAADQMKTPSLTGDEKVSAMLLIDCLNQETGVNAFCQTCDMACPLRNISTSRTLYIKPDGSLYPCQLLGDRAFSLGNLSSSSDIIENRLREISHLAQKREIMDYHCLSCFLRSSCKRGCMAAAVIAKGGPLGDDGNCDFRKRQYLRRELRGLR